MNEQTQTPLREVGLSLLAVGAMLAGLSCGGGDIQGPTTGSLGVTTVTTGELQDADGYSVALDGGSGQVIGLNATLTMANLSSGTHEVQLSGVAANCNLQGANPRSVAVSAGSTAEVTFAISCTAATGSLEITTTTTGSAPDPDGYSVTVDNAAPQTIGVTATLAVPGVSVGAHQVTLAGLATNCRVDGPNSLTVVVVVGAPATAAFAVSCPAPGVTSWTPMESGTPFTLVGVWGASATDVYAVGSSQSEAGILHFDGASWTKQSSAAIPFPQDIWGSSSRDVFAVSGVVLEPILHYDGTSWTPMSPPSGENRGLEIGLWALWGASATDVFAVGRSICSNCEDTDDVWGSISHYDGTAWSLMSQSDADLYDVWGSSGTDAYAVGVVYASDAHPSDRGQIIHYNGTTWSPVFSEVGLVPTGIWGSSASDIFVVGLEGTILHYDGRHWLRMPSPTKQSLYELWGTSGTNVFAVGQGGTILHYDGRQWSGMLSPTQQNLYAVSGTSATDVFVVGDGGIILHGTP
jgi:hypothetical protein